MQGDAYLDRRRLKRRLTFWRIFGLVAAAAAVIAAAGRFDIGRHRDHVARLAIEGLILDDQVRREALKELSEDERAKALIVAIDSPGGTFFGGQALYQELRDIAGKKPVVAVLGGVATSAAYMTALGSDHIIARSGSLTGSIGVILQTVDVTGLLEKLGIKPETIKSGPMKAQPNPLEPFTPEARRATEAVIEDLYDMFIGIVAKRRKMTREQVLNLADGRVFSGRQAKERGLVDALGAEPEARQWLAKTHEIDAALPVIEMVIEHEDEPWRDMIQGLIGKALFSERLRLDGGISLWHPDLY
ncbi:MAG: signal peptide peptidase SppA [Rhodospirillales bacterium]